MNADAALYINGRRLRFQELLRQNKRRVRPDPSATFMPPGNDAVEANSSISQSWDLTRTCDFNQQRPGRAWRQSGLERRKFRRLPAAHDQPVNAVTQRSEQGLTRPELSGSQP
jgi:hypothetical protein